MTLCAAEPSLVYLDMAVEAMGKELEKIVTDYEATDGGEEIEINGMNAFMADGIGKVEGKPVEVGQALVFSPTDKVLILIGISKARPPTLTSKRSSRSSRASSPSGKGPS